MSDNEQTKVAHPERQAGQRYSLWGEEYVIDSLRPTDVKFPGEWNARIVGGGYADTPCILSEATLHEGTLLAPAQSPVCGAPEWCGRKYARKGVPYRCRCDGECDNPLEHAVMFTADNSPRAFIKDTDPVWCSAACRDARVPPIAAAPVTTACPGCGAKEAERHQQGCSAVAQVTTAVAPDDSICCPNHYSGRRVHNAWCKNAESAAKDLGTGVDQRPMNQSAKAAAPVPATCSLCRTAKGVAERFTKNIGTGYVENDRRCDACFLSQERGFTRGMNQSGASYLHDDKHPERLPRPKMAHVAGSDDEELRR